jgi:hypothetical protein
MKVAWQFTAKPGRTVPSRRGLSDFAAKRLYRTAQGLNPGLGVARIRPESTSNPLRGCNSEREHSI